MANKAELGFSIGEHVVAPVLDQCMEVGGAILRLFGLSGPSSNESNKTH